MSKNVASAPFVRALPAAILAAAALVGFSSLALAAEADADAEEADDVELEEVQVTGTRIQNPNVTSANPITSVSGEEMRALGFVNVADALTQLVPQNISTYMPSMIGDDQAGAGGGGMDFLDRGNYFIGNTIANLRGLDPTFGTRTLTLIDGRRVPSTSNQADVVDLNIIPSNLLQRMDVVTGGASTTYGSGAVAGVVNLVLNNRMQGVNLDLDYGLNEAGDGESPHVSLSAGRSFFGGKGHGLIGLEWQDQKPINDCAAARAWCAESRTEFNNYSGFGGNVSATFTPLVGYQDFPARFEMANVRYSQFAPTGTLFFNNANVTSNLMFDEGGTELEEYALGFRGGLSGSGGGLPQAMNGDGPLITQGRSMRPASERKSLFLNFEYNFTERTTGYVQANYARTDSRSETSYTAGNYCVRFNAGGSAAQLGAVAGQNQVISGGGSSWPAVAVVDLDEFLAGNPNPTPVEQFTAGSQWNNTNFRQWLGWSTLDGPTTIPAPGFVAPYWVSGGTTGVYPANSGATRTTPPQYTFANATNLVWVHVKNNPPSGQEWWVLRQITLSADFADPGLPPVFPEMGRNAYAFLNALSPEALNQVRGAFADGGNYGAIVDGQTGVLLTGASTTSGGGAGLDNIYGPSPCQGFTAMRKVWNPQLAQHTTQRQEPWRALVGLRGRFGRDWRWDGFVQYGRTDSTSQQFNVPTNLRLSMAIDAVIDDRPFLPDGVTVNPTYGQPVCRVTRDGVPAIDYQGRPVSQLDDLRALADGCQPINLFGSSYAGYDYFGPGYDAARIQQEAIDFAFVESLSRGFNSLATVSFNTNGTLWQGWAGPLTTALGIEIREDKVNNVGTSGSSSIYERADLSRAWADGFGGKTRATEGYVELNMPFVSGQEGVNLLSGNLGWRYASYYNKGGLGTTGQSNTQDTTNWKAQLIFEPFDFVRFRLSRSRDLRAATYRDLFINQSQIPDQFAGENPWRPYNPQSDEARQERWAQVRVGNPDLKPETSDTLTLGMVLSPGGWAQGMNLSADYFDIRVRGGINTPFMASTTAMILSCWENSGNTDGDPGNPDSQPVNGNFDYDFYDEALSAYPCREITFAPLDPGQDPTDPSNFNLQDIVSYNSARPQNGLPYQRRGVDVQLRYTFPLNRAFESLPGTMSLTVRGSRALESSGLQVNAGSGNNPNAVSPTQCQQQGGTYENFNCYIYQDLVGQIRSSVFIPGVAASPKWTGNIIGTYSVGSLTTSLSARYIGAAYVNKTWCDNVDCPNYQDADGNYLLGSIDNNWVKPYFNFSLNGSYNMQIANLKQFQVFGSINNLFDKSPPFTGGGISGANAQYHDTMGRAYRFGVRMRF